MRICCIVPMPPPHTGQSVCAEAVVNGLIGRGHSIDLVLMNKRTLASGVSYNYRIVEVLRIIGKTCANVARADRVFLSISQSRSGNLKDMLIYLLCFPLLGRFTIHSQGGAGIAVLFNGGKSVAAALNRIFLRRVGAVIVEGNTQKKHFEPLVPGDRIHVVPNFASSSLFLTAQQVEAKFRLVPGAVLRLLFLSNLINGKGHKELLAAYGLLTTSEQAALRIDFAGGFDSPSEQQRFLARMAEYTNIQYHGVVTGDRKRELLNKAHVFCLPTAYPYEGQPVALLEAYASGCAAITTYHSGIPDVFRDGANGFVVSAGNPESIANALRKALASPSSLAEFGQYNLREASQRFTLDRFQCSMGTIITAGGNAGDAPK